MNPISSLTGAVTHPVRTAGSAAGQTLGVASRGLGMAMGVVGWVASRATGRLTPEDSSSDAVPFDAVPSDDAPPEMSPVEAVTTAPPATKATAERAPARKGAIRAPSAKAAVVAPARGVPEDEVVGDDEVVEDDDLHTRSGGQAADRPYDPADPDTEPLLDPATAKAVASESAMLRKAADPNKG